MSKGKLELLGKYSLGPRLVDVFINPNHGNGSFAMMESGMEIGLAHSAFEVTMGVLIHEALEFAMADMRCRWNPAPDINSAHDSYLFVMTHPEMGEATARVGQFLVPVVSPLHAAWKKAQKV